MEQRGINTTGRKQAQKTSSTGEGMVRREANTPINLTKGHTMLMFNKVSPCLRMISEKSTAAINPLMNRTRGALEPVFLKHLILSWRLAQ